MNDFVDNLNLTGLTTPKNFLATPITDAAVGRIIMSRPQWMHVNHVIIADYILRGN